ncbi:putative annexin [Tripterygium wilfordii]|uniref:Putative annexin n=1 Tax=Tripterygium wilfordii TaxID=458696 RepID=A0A7J7C5C8_TRIWF|nr:annexin D4 [Tripterygium wilfordii]KAF5729312.1 putative annexin [Tripterygium wilfordii]
MDHANDLEALNNALSGIGVDEKALILIAAKPHPEHTRSLRKGNPHLFREDDERNFEHWNNDAVKLLKHEFVRFKNAVVFWAMHPWERDARLVKEALMKGPNSYNVIVEIACTRSSEELIGARKAYHSLFEHSMEEELATHIHGHQRKLLVAHVSAYRYEGLKVMEDTAKTEAKVLANAIKNGDKKQIIEDEEVVRILTTRSKPHLKALYKHYKEISGTNLDEDVAGDMIMESTVQCLCNPQVYFCKVLDAALKVDVHKHAKKGLTRVVVTRADVDMKVIKEEFNKLYGIPLSKKVEDLARGSYKDLILTLLARQN